MVGVSFHFSNEGAVSSWFDAYDDCQVFVGDILFADGPGAAGDGCQQTVDLRLPGGETTLTVLL